MQLSTILCTVLVASVAAEYAEEEDVLVLTEANMKQAIADFKYLLVEFCTCIAITYGFGIVELRVRTPSDRMLFVRSFYQGWR